ncbi:hypothetical protein BgiBS90_024967, partial [Biomphalaria glabrata]
MFNINSLRDKRLLGQPVYYFSDKILSHESLAHTAHNQIGYCPCCLQNNDQ